MNECADREIKELLPDLLHHTLRSEDRARVELHVAGCESCREDLSVLRTVKSAAVFAPAIDVGRIVRQIPPYQRIVPAVEAPARNRVARWLVAAAAAVLIVGGGSVVLNRQPAGKASVATADDTLTGASAERGGSTEVSISPNAPVATMAASPAHTFALASDVASLSDGDLQQLMNEMDDFDALPAAEPEPAIAIDTGDSL
jgi:predicted anti-sigma-YlaC factor YlaD